MADIHYLPGGGGFSEEEAPAPIPPAEQVRAAASSARPGTATHLGNLGQALPVNPGTALSPYEGATSPVVPGAHAPTLPGWVWPVGGTLAFLGLLWWLQSRHQRTRLVNPEDDDNPIERVRRERLGEWGDDEELDDDD